MGVEKQLRTIVNLQFCYFYWSRSIFSSSFFLLFCRVFRCVGLVWASIAFSYDPLPRTICIQWLNWAGQLLCILADKGNQSHVIASNCGMMSCPPRNVQMLGCWTLDPAALKVVYLRNCRTWLKLNKSPVFCTKFHQFVAIS